MFSRHYEEAAADAKEIEARGMGGAGQTNIKHTDATEGQIDSEQDSNPQQRMLRIALLMSVMVAADIGGTGVETGTGPNMVLISFLHE